MTLDEIRELMGENSLCHAMADEIERLRAEFAKRDAVVEAAREKTKTMVAAAFYEGVNECQNHPGIACGHLWETSRSKAGLCALDAAKGGDDG